KAAARTSRARQARAMGARSERGSRRRQVPSMGLYRHPVPGPHRGWHDQLEDEMADTAVAKHYPHLIGGREVTSERTFESRNASDASDLIGVFPEATREQVADACRAAQGAFPAWSRTPAPIRGQI